MVPREDPIRRSQADHNHGAMSIFAGQCVIADEPRKRKSSAFDPKVLAFDTRINQYATVRRRDEVGRLAIDRPRIRFQTPAEEIVQGPIFFNGEFGFRCIDAERPYEIRNLRSRRRPSLHPSIQ